MNVSLSTRLLTSVVREDTLSPGTCKISLSGDKKKTLSIILDIHPEERIIQRKTRPGGNRMQCMDCRVRHARGE